MGDFGDAFLAIYYGPDRACWKGAGHRLPRPGAGAPGGTRLPCSGCLRRASVPCVPDTKRILTTDRTPPTTRLRPVGHRPTRSRRRTYNHGATLAVPKEWTSSHGSEDIRTLSSRHVCAGLLGWAGCDSASNEEAAENARQQFADRGSRRPAASGGRKAPGPRRRSIVADPPTIMSKLDDRGPAD